MYVALFSVRSSFLLSFVVFIAVLFDFFTIAAQYIVESLKYDRNQYRWKEGKNKRMQNEKVATKNENGLSVSQNLKFSS